MEQAVSYKQSRFSYARLESVMMTTGTSWDELEVISGIHHLAQDCKTKGIPRETVQVICEHMQCDPAYIFMESNDPKIGQYKGFRVIVETKPKDKDAAPPDIHVQTRPDGTPAEPNQIDRDRVKKEMDRQGWWQRTMVMFLDASPSCTSVTSQMLRNRTLPVHTTENISWLLGVTIEYLCGKTKNPQEGTIGERHIPESHTAVLDPDKLSAQKLTKTLGIPYRIAQWLKEEPRQVSPELARTVAFRMGIGTDTLVKEAGKPAESKPGKKVKTQEKSKTAANSAAGASFKPVLELLQRMDNADLDRTEKLIKVLKGIGTPVTSDDFVKLEMVIETQRDFNNAQKNRLDALSMFS